jgi:hypothetical protein
MLTPEARSASAVFGVMTVAGLYAEKLHDDAAKAKPGVLGNLIITMVGERAPAANDKPAAPRRQRLPMGTLPALPFEIE